MHESKLPQLKEYATTLDETLNKAEFLDAFKAVVGAVKAARDELVSGADNHRQEVAQRLDAALTHFTQQLQAAHAKIDTNAASAQASTSTAVVAAVATLRSEIAALSAETAKTPDVQAMIQALVIPSITDLENNLPQLGERIRDALELLPDESKLPIEAIKDLRKELDALKKGLRDVGSGGGVILSRGAVMVYDLSGLLDGVTKTFALPAFWRVLEVKSTSTPVIFRPTTDYTVDASAMTITFTSQIDAASTLSAGQTLLVLYQQP
jgi:hypothetical protein